MWPFNSTFSSKINQSSFTIKSSFSDKIKDNNFKDLSNGFSFQTPIKSSNSNIADNNNLTPFKLGFNFYLTNVYSSEPTDINPINNLFNFSSHNSASKDKKRENDKKSTEKSSYEFSPEFYNKKNKNNSMCSMNNNSFSSECMKIRNMNGLIQKNLSLLFSDIKDENSMINNNENDKNFFMKSMAFKYEDKEEILISNNNNSINSCKNNSSKKIFECSNSTSFFSPMSYHKKRRIRKNNEQLFLLRKFYTEHKYWSKNQIKEISHLTGIKENKVYKWLWDQRNKEIKNTKFTVNKTTEKNI
jgi:hypothetical protein